MTNHQSLRFPIQYVELIERIVKPRGGDMKALLKRCAIPAEDVTKLGATICLDQFQALMAASEAFLLPGEPRSLQIVKRLPLTVHGSAGMAAITADTIGRALELGVMYSPLIMPAFELRLEKGPTHTQVSVRRNHDFGSPFNEVLTEVIIGTFRRIADFVSDPDVGGPASLDTSMQVSFMHDSNEDPKAYEDYFGAPVQFRRQHSSFTVNNEVLRRPLHTRSRASSASLQAGLEQDLRERSHEAFTTILTRRQVSKLLQGGAVPHATAVSEALMTSVRTLRRRLANEGSSLTEIVDELRVERARWLLTSSQMPIVKIASSLGFSDSSTFSRAFKRATGTSPGELRRPRQTK